MTSKLFKIIKKEIQIDSSENDLYELLPRFVNEERLTKDTDLKPVERGFMWEGEAFQLFINPAAVEDEGGQALQYKHYFPGLQESQIETALIELAAQDKDFDADGKKKFAFTLSQLQNHLTTNNYHLSREQIKHLILILAGCAYIIIGKDTKWIFRTIETLAMVEEEADVQFLAYFGDLIVEQIKKYKLNQPKD